MTGATEPILLGAFVGFEDDSFGIAVPPITGLRTGSETELVNQAGEKGHTLYDVDFTEVVNFETLVGCKVQMNGGQV